MLIDADVSGSGPAVLLLHAGVADRRMWAHQATVLVEAGFQVVRPDLRGYGSSPPAAEPWSSVSDVLALADSWSLDRFSLVGSSAGGAVALQIAARCPSRVEALVLLCPAAPDLDASETLLQIWREEARLIDAGDRDGAVDVMLEHFLGPDADRDARALVAAMQRRAYDLQLASDIAQEEDEDTADLRAITAPTLALAGAYDLPDFTQVARRISREVPGAELLELPWAGHLPSLERPAETSRLVREFLQKTVTAVQDP